ncbi:DUF4198 domain-containing protein [Rhodocyclus purpureus]|uniref:DUF4198 domain-containing protein n=1 Tax=Rhodocyclus purpureus TaxID=1067 RepID=UPI001913E0A8|nr:DUF4198 domain-containing protein [Rhodocyclus purpureus]MBK5915397.1 ABC transporter permease [Rhodocyclus purpureus]
MPRLRPLLVLASLGSALLSSAAHAHSAWLLPSSTVVSKAQWITVDAAVANDLFFFNHQPLALEHLRVTGPDGAPRATENLLRGRLRSVFDVELRDKGSYRLAVINEGLLASYKLNGENKRWRGSAADFARALPPDASALKLGEMFSRVETFVTLGAPSPLRAEGRGLEVLPEQHDLFSGETTRFRLTIDGQAAAGIEVSVLRGGSRYRNHPEEIRVKSDGEGRFAVTWPQPGMYWLEAETTDRKTTHPEASERRLSYSATLEVLPQ